MHSTRFVRRKRLSLEPSHIAAIQKLDEELRSRASVEPFFFIVQDIQPNWFNTFPPEQLQVENGLLQDVTEEETMDTAHIRAMRLASEKFGPRILVIAQLVEPILSAGLGRNALSVVAHIRSHIDDVDTRVDLYLVLVAPPGSDSSEIWQDAVRRVERNEHICRTFAWLPSADSTLWSEAIAEFLSRTFLARPFEHRTISPQVLDPLRGLLIDKLKQAGGSDELLFSTEQLNLLETILTSSEPGRDTAEKLIDAFERFNS